MAPSGAKMETSQAMMGLQGGMKHSHGKNTETVEMYGVGHQ